MENQMIALVENYFRGVDNQHFDEIAETLSEDCVFTVETHGVRLQGLDEIGAMFTRLWSNHASVEHRDFSYLSDPGKGRIAAQFTVVNSELDGRTTRKSNCNFFSVSNGRFTTVAVYMAGQNTLTAE